MKTYQTELVEKWIKQIDAMAEIAKSEPHSVYVAFIHGFQHKLTYFMRTLPNFSNALHKLDEAIDTKLLPIFLNSKNISSDERKLVSLPARYGGMGYQFLKICVLLNMQTPNVFLQKT